MRTPTVRKRLGCIYALITFTMMMLMPQGIGQALASNAPEDSWRYTVTLSGTKQLKLDMPVYDEDGYDSWIDDGQVNVSDVTALVTIILGGDDSEPHIYNHKAADVNADNAVNVSDVTALVTIILGLN